MRINLEAVANQGDLVDQGDIDVALGVFEHLGELGDPDRRRAMSAGSHNAAIHRVNNFQGCGRVRGDDFKYVSKRRSLSPGLMRSGEYPTLKSVFHLRLKSAPR